MDLSARGSRPSSTVTVVATTITVHAGSSRSGAGPVSSTVQGLSGATYTATPKSGSGGSFTCTTTSAGTCSMSVVPGVAYSVALSGTPAGFYPFPTLDSGNDTTETTHPYQFTTGTLALGSTTNVPAATFPGVFPDNSSPAQRFSGLFAAGVNNPTASQACGIRIALILDQSGSMANNNKQTNLKAAATDAISSLANTPTTMAIYTFAAQANSAGSIASTTLATSAGQSALTNFVTNLPAPAGFTNWDAGIYQAVTASKQYDLVILLTDGNPTTYGAGSTDGTNSYFAYTERGAFSANALKALGTEVVAVGIGVDGGLDNLSAVTGPTEGTDYFNGSSSNFGQFLHALATGNCQNTVTVQKQIRIPPER